MCLKSEVVSIKDVLCPTLARYDSTLLTLGLCIHFIFIFLLLSHGRHENRKQEHSGSQM